LRAASSHTTSPTFAAGSFARALDEVVDAGAAVLVALAALVALAVLVALVALVVLAVLAALVVLVALVLAALEGLAAFVLDAALFAAGFAALALVAVPSPPTSE
jgi:hypothetical protein